MQILPDHHKIEWYNYYAFNIIRVIKKAILDKYSLTYEDTNSNYEWNICHIDDHKKNNKQSNL